jgi:hypothetical protein
VRARLIAGLWLIVGVVIWNAFFDLYVSRGARRYGQEKAEYDLGQGPPVSMEAVMREARQDGLVMATVWSGLVVGAGWATIWALRTYGSSSPHLRLEHDRRASGADRSGPAR